MSMKNNYFSVRNVNSKFEDKQNQSRLHTSPSNAGCDQTIIDQKQLAENLSHNQTNRSNENLHSLKILTAENNFFSYSSQPKQSFDRSSSQFPQQTNTLLNHIPSQSPINIVKKSQNFSKPQIPQYDLIDTGSFKSQQSSTQNIACNFKDDTIQTKYHDTQISSKQLNASNSILDSFQDSVLTNKIPQYQNSIRAQIPDNQNPTVKIDLLSNETDSEIKPKDQKLTDVILEMEKILSRGQSNFRENFISQKFEMDNFLKKQIDVVEFEQLNDDQKQRKQQLEEFFGYLNRITIQNNNFMVHLIQKKQQLHQLHENIKLTTQQALFNLLENIKLQIKNQQLLLEQEYEARQAPIKQLVMKLTQNNEDALQIKMDISQNLDNIFSDMEYQPFKQIIQQYTEKINQIEQENQINEYEFKDYRLLPSDEMKDQIHRISSLLKEVNQILNSNEQTSCSISEKLQNQHQQQNLKLMITENLTFENSKNYPIDQRKFSEIQNIDKRSNSFQKSIKSNVNYDPPSTQSKQGFPNFSEEKGYYSSQNYESQSPQPKGYSYQSINNITNKFKVPDKDDRRANSNANFQSVNQKPVQSVLRQQQVKNGVESHPQINKCGGPLRDRDINTMSLSEEYQVQAQRDEKGIRLNMDQYQSIDTWEREFGKDSDSQLIVQSPQNAKYLDLLEKVGATQNFTNHFYEGFLKDGQTNSQNFKENQIQNIDGRSIIDQPSSNNEYHLEPTKLELKYPEKVTHKNQPLQLIIKN